MATPKLQIEYTRKTGDVVRYVWPSTVLGVNWIEVTFTPADGSAPNGFSLTTGWQNELAIVELIQEREQSHH